MTHPGGPAPESQTPRPWPPQQQVPPPWPAQQPSPRPWAPQPQGPPAAPRQDSTRTIAVIALVLSGVTLLGVGAMTFAPLLFFGLFATTFGSGFDDLDDGSLLSSTGVVHGGEVTPAADGSVAGPTLAAAVVPLVSADAYDGMAERTSCDAVPHVAADVSVLCRADDPTWYGIVRFTGTDGSFEVVTVGDTAGSIP